MKRLILFLINIYIFMGSTTVLGATEAETPMKEYVRNGVSYQMYSVAMSEFFPEYNEKLEKVAQDLFEEKPLIYGYLIDSDLKSVLGFQKEFTDGSKAIYINVNNSLNRGIQIFVHEMVHYKYDVPGAVMYVKDSNGCYRYKQLMEALTDVIAQEKYATISEYEYEKAYSYPVLDRVLQEDKEGILISLYKGEIVLSTECYTSLDKLNRAIKYGYLDRALEAYKEIKDMAKRDEKLFSSLFCNQNVIYM